MEGYRLCFNHVYYHSEINKIEVLLICFANKDLITDTGFWRGYQEKRCVHIGARRRIEPGHGARAPSVNTALHSLHLHLRQDSATCIFL